MQTSESLISMTKHFVQFLAMSCLVTVFAMLPAGAQSLTGNVGSAGVTKGEQSVEGRLGLDDEGNAASRFHYDNALTDWYMFRLIGSFSKPDGEDWDLAGLTAENWFQWREERADNSGFNGGLRFAYTFAQDDGPDEAEVRLTLTDKFAGDWEWRSNLIAEMEAGDGSQGGVELEVRGQISRAVDLSALGSDDWRLGLEVFSELGNSRDLPGFDDQAHQVGPMVKISWDNGLFLQSAVRAGVTGGADDGMVKLFIGREF